MTIFCTYFDSNYLDRGICLWQSLSSFLPDARLFVCCLDRQTYDVLQSFDLAGVTAVHLSDLEKKYPQLIEIKERRSNVEYYFTITPSWIRYVLEQGPSAEYVTYLDSDLLFFSSPQPLFDEMAAKNGHVGIVGHRFTPQLGHLSIYGLYNVGWITFRPTKQGLDCLLEWQRKCIEWCHDYVDGDRFADQKYLDAWPAQHKNVVVLEHSGANVALWNLEPLSVQRRAGSLSVHGKPLIFYHFHGLSQVSRRWFFTSARMYGITLSPIVRRQVYGRYIRKLLATQKYLKSKNVQPLIRYKHSPEDVRYAKSHPLSGLFIFSIFDLTMP